MRNKVWRFAVPLLAALMLLVGGATVLPSISAQAGVADGSVHTRSGRVINVLVAGDSYAAGNGADGATYNVSPDDPKVPPVPYSGPGCWRKFNNSSMRAYNQLGSTGFYVNRACSGRLTSDVLPEVADLVGTPTAGKVDLIVYSAGGNDVKFSDIASHCILVPGNDAQTVFVNGSNGASNGRWISRQCKELLDWMGAKTQLDNVLASERANLLGLLSRFPNAKIVMDGYPFLSNKVTAKGKTDTHNNTINYAYEVMSGLMPDIAGRQKAMVADLARANGGRVAFNDVFAAFGGVANNHGVYSKDPWIYGLRPSTLVMESVHPNPVGHMRIADGIVSTVSAAGWFKTFPTRPAQTAPTFNHIPGDGVENGGYLATDSGGNVYTTTTLVSQLASCKQQTLTFSGWRGQRGVLELASTGPDTIKVRCEYPRAGDIVRRGSATYLVGGSGVGFTLQHITTGWMHNCLVGKSGVRQYAISQGLLVVKGGASAVPGRAECVPGDWRNHVVSAPSGAAYFVDGSGYKHYIRTIPTLYALEQRYGGAIRPAQVDVDTIPSGGDQPEQLHPNSHFNTIIRRADGVSWVVDGAGVRHHIPTYAEDVCFRWVRGLRVSETGLSYELANSLPESNAWNCFMNGVIIATNEGASYYMDGNTRRWITDVESFYAYAAGRTVIRGMSMNELRPVPEGGWMPRRLDPNRARNHLVRVSDGTAYYVTNDGIWHWIPNGGTYNCLIARHSLLIHDATWEQVNSIRNEGNPKSWANCGM